jgi:hypothetical protein
MRKDYRKALNSPMFIGCLFIGLGLGFLFDQVVAGAMLGVGVGFLAAWFFGDSH